MFSSSIPPGDELERWDLSELEFNYRALVDRHFSQASLAEDPEAELAEVGLLVLEALENAKAHHSPEELTVAQEDLQTIQKWCLALAFHPSLKSRSEKLPSLKTPLPG